MKESSFRFRFIHSQSWSFCQKYRYELIIFMFVLMFLIEGYRLYCYYNRLELINKFEYNNNVFEFYQDWSKSTHYYMKYSERVNADNYYVIKKNGELYFRYQHNYPFAESYQAFFFLKIEQDSLVFVQRGSEHYGVVYLKMPLNKDKITKKDVRIVAIYVDILKNGKQVTLNDTTVYLLDDYKKVPKEVIDYEHVISDY